MYKSYDEMLEELEREMRRVSDDVLLHMFRISSTSGEVWSPRMDVYETTQSVVVKVCAAGLDPDQIELTISGDNRFITLRGVRVETTRIRRTGSVTISWKSIMVRSSGSSPCRWISRSTRDMLSAAYRDGFLKIVLPKLQQARPIKKIDIED